MALKRALCEMSKWSFLTFWCMAGFSLQKWTWNDEDDIGTGRLLSWNVEMDCDLLENKFRLAYVYLM